MDDDGFNTTDLIKKQQNEIEITKLKINTLELQIEFIEIERKNLIIKKKGILDNTIYEYQKLLNEYEFDLKKLINLLVIINNNIRILEKRELKRELPNIEELRKWILSHPDEDIKNCPFK